MKRAADVALAVLGLALTWPAFLLAALAIRLDSAGPVLFTQERVGRNFSRFRILKFRTMRVDAERNGPGVTPLGDPRVTRVGRFLRASKLDELPQLWNVLRGDMSLVGPRPELPRFVRIYAKEFREILKVRPGITDPASIAYRAESALLAGVADPEAEYVRSVLPAKIRLARLYVQRASWMYDLRLVLQTLLLLAYPSGLVDRLIQGLGRRHALFAMLIQAGLAALACVAALVVRFDGAPPSDVCRRVLLLLPALVAIRAFWIWRFRLHRDVWRYFGPREMGAIVCATALGSVTFAPFLAWMQAAPPLPVSIVILDGLLCVVALAGVRAARGLHERLRTRPAAPRTVLLVGSGDSAERFLLDRTGPGGRECRIVGLVSDRATPRGLLIHEVPIVGSIDELDRILPSLAPDEIVVLASSLPAARRSEVIHACRAAGRPVKVVPDLDDILRRDLSVLRLSQPEAEDILFRQPVPVDLARVASCFRGRRVMVTGAGGSIGSEICRQIAACSPERLVMFEIHEESLYHIEREVRGLHPRTDVHARVGDVRDAARLRDVLETTRPEFVFHAAAYKHVPMMEHNAREAYKTNVLGTRCLGEAAVRAGVSTFVLVSTDKAVEPACVMGASKRMAELAVRELAARSATRFLTVRFGNVLESSGSVIPLFREQIERGGPVTVTHRDMTRWFMTVAEAVHLILQAANMGCGGEVFVLDMGKPVRILDVACALIRLYGLRPGVDMPIAFTGLRPGERLFERLFNPHERVWRTAHARILKAVEASRNGAGKAQRAHELSRLMSFFPDPSASRIDPANGLDGADGAARPAPAARVTIYA